VPAATIADLDDAIAAAERGFKVWRKTSPAKRDSAVIQRFEGHFGGDLESDRWDERFGHLRSQPCFLGSLTVIIGQT